MSRDFRDDIRDERAEREVERSTEFQARHTAAGNTLFGRHLELPRGETRERIDGGDRTHLLDETDMRTLATIGAFRIVSVEDLQATADLRDADLRRLSDEGLITRETLADVAGSRQVVSLMPEGKAVLEAHRGRDSEGPYQAFYAGFAKPRELAHDAHVYRAFKEEEARIEAAGGRVTRVVLDYELKREYQRFLNREDRSDDATLESDRRAFAEANDLHVLRGHLELPDLRIEYEIEDGRVEHRDVEIVSEHYSRGQISGKTRARFACYSIAGSNARKGGTPFDPRHLSRLS